LKQREEKWGRAVFQTTRRDIFLNALDHASSRQIVAHYTRVDAQGKQQLHTFLSTGKRLL
jgi:hypothetical protein